MNREAVLENVRPVSRDCVVIQANRSLQARSELVFVGTGYGLGASRIGGIGISTLRACREQCSTFPDMQLRPTMSVRWGKADSV